MSKAAVFASDEEGAFTGFIIRLENGSCVPVNRSIAQQIEKEVKEGQSIQQIADKHFASYHFDETLMEDIIAAATRYDRVKEEQDKKHKGHKLKKKHH